MTVINSTDRNKWRDGRGRRRRRSLLVAALMLAVAGGVVVTPVNLATAASLASGTEFWALNTENTLYGPEPFTLEITNTGASAATVTVAGWDIATNAPTSLSTTIVSAGGADHIELDSLTVVKQGLSKQGVYKITSDKPISIISLAAGESAQSNDGLTLLPTSMLGEDYFAVTRNGGPLPTFVAVVATQANTQITVTPTIGHTPVDYAPDREQEESRQALMKGPNTYELRQPLIGVRETATLQPFEVYYVRSSPGADLTGTEIVSDKPVAVFSGAVCATVGQHGSCDHLVEQMWPEEDYDSTYAICPTLPPHMDDWPYLDDLQAYDNGWLTTTPSEPPYPSYGYAPDASRFRVLSNGFWRGTTALDIEQDDGSTQALTMIRGQWLEFEAPHGAIIEASTSVIVAEFMGGDTKPVYGPDWSWGDPSITQLVGENSLATSFTFTTPESFPLDLAVFTAKSTNESPQIQLDGVNIPEWEWHQISDSDYFCSWRLWLADGVHTVSGTSGSTANVRIAGLDNYGSYAMPVVS